eukprot:6355188-Prymnesium_polylepis.2
MARVGRFTDDDDWEPARLSPIQTPRQHPQLGLELGLDVDEPLDQIIRAGHDRTRASKSQLSTDDEDSMVGTDVGLIRENRPKKRGAGKRTGRRKQRLEKSGATGSGTARGYCNWFNVGAGKQKARLSHVYV